MLVTSVSFRVNRQNEIAYVRIRRFFLWASEFRIAGKGFLSLHEWFSAVAGGANNGMFVCSSVVAVHIVLQRMWLLSVIRVIISCIVFMMSHMIRV